MTAWSARIGIVRDAVARDNTKPLPHRKGSTRRGRGHARDTSMRWAGGLQRVYAVDSGTDLTIVAHETVRA